MKRRLLLSGRLVLSLDYSWSVADYIDSWSARSLFRLKPSLADIGLAAMAAAMWQVVENEP